MSEHYFTEVQNTSFEPFFITIRTKRIKEFKISSASGIFSLKKLDNGTEVLLNYMQLPDKGNVLDLGCGYGVVGISVLKLNHKLNLTFVDSNSRAIKLTKINLKEHKFRAKTCVSDTFSQIDTETFDLILTNPPYSAGRDVCTNFIKESFNHLNKNGSIQLVCRRQKGGDFLESYMNEVFGNVEIIGQKSGFRLYKSVKE